MESTTHAPAEGQVRHIAPRTYIIVFVWLTILTGVEVLIASIGLPEAVKVPVLVVIAIIKAALVVLFYMHLLYDSRWFWLTLLVPLGFVLLLGRYLMQH